MKVMIVDDNQAIHEIVRDALGPEVDDFADCSDGNEAVALYRTYHPDWVLMDIMMEKMDGLLATEAILAEDPHAKIIMITQHNEPSLREKAKRIGAVDFVLKENLEDLGHIIRGQTN
jgi:two-component system response regulator DegU